MSTVKKIIKIVAGPNGSGSLTVKRRHLRCFENFWQIYKPLADEWLILDNSATKPKLIQNSITFEKLTVAQKNKFSKKIIKGVL